MNNEKKNKKDSKHIDKEIRIEDTTSNNVANTDKSDKMDVEESEQTSDELQNAEEKLSEELEKAKNEITSLHDMYLRQVAEFDNYRKRMLKEKSELILNGGEKVITSLLPVLDDFERALDNIKKGGESETLLQGVELIYQKFVKILGSHGLKQIDTTNADFDTDFHEAIAMIPAADENSKGKVVDCVQQGYTLNNKVIRHAKVAVGQ